MLCEARRGARGSWLIALAVLGCGSNDAADTGGAGSSGSGGNAGSGGSAAGGANGGTAGAGSGASGGLLGGFKVNLSRADAITSSQGFTTVHGSVYESARPPIGAWNTEDEQSGCVLLTPRPLLCSPACGAGQTCVEDDSGVHCVMLSRSTSAGTLRITGLATVDGPAELRVEPTVTTSSVSYQSATLPENALAEGAEVRIEASGGTFEPFELRATGIATLEVADAEFPLERGSSASLRWTPPAEPEIGRIQITLDISHHGGLKGQIECNVADTGSFEIPADMVTALIDLGVAGYPTIGITRLARGTTDVARGTVELVVYSGTERPVTIPGLVSCMGPADCAEGQTCDLSDYTCK
jgi:hypothetical protein